MVPGCKDGQGGFALFGGKVGGKDWGGGTKGVEAVLGLGDDADGPLLERLALWGGKTLVEPWFVRQAD